MAVALAAGAARPRRPGPRRAAPASRAAATRDRRREPDPEPERHWRDDPRLLRAYGWLTVLWGVTFLLRALVQGLLYQANDVGLLGTVSLVLGLPVTAVERRRDAVGGRPGCTGTAARSRPAEARGLTARAAEARR